METTNTKPAAIHPFEKAGLGMGPFRCTGSYESKFQAIPGDPSCPIQPGSSCDYCGTAIMNVFKIRSADKKEFKVGCDCVAKTYRECAKTELERDARKLHDQINKIKTAAANARKDVKIVEALAKLEANRAALEGRIWDGVVRHNHGPKSVADHLDWLFRCSGRAGRIRAAALLDRLLA